jgi:hypothetical protein
MGLALLDNASDAYCLLCAASSSFSLKSLRVEDLDDDLDLDAIAPCEQFRLLSCLALEIS